MSVFSDSIGAKVQGVLDMSWDVRDGTVVPDTDSVKLSGGAVKIDATYLYADLGNSSGAAHKLKKEVTGKIVRSYLDAASRIILHFGGAIRSFDGDRVMGIFIGDSKNTSAVKTALGINWAVDEVLTPKFKAKWSTLSNFWTLYHGVGVDTGEAFVIRGGVRDNNDLVSIGTAPNVAAKLSSLRGTPDIYITKDVFDQTNTSMKVTDGKDMWTIYSSQTIGGTTYSVRGSTWRRRP